jgi:RNA-dependent RNA polymerase
MYGGDSHRVKEAMRPGIDIGGRRYEFLAYSSSQLKEQSVWLFAPCDDLSTQDVLEFMGDFSQIRCIGKAAARMGQCFSSTVDAMELQVRISHDSCR